MADDPQPLQITVPRRGANVVQGLPPSEGGGGDLIGQFMKLVQPGTQPPQEQPSPSPQPGTPDLLGEFQKLTQPKPGHRESSVACASSPERPERPEHLSLLLTQ